MPDSSEVARYDPPRTLSGGFRAPAVLAGQYAVCLPEPAAEMGHIGKTPAVRDLAYRPMRLRWVFQRPSATFKAPRLNQTHDGCVVLGEHSIGVSHTHSCGGGHSLSVERRVGQPRFDRGAHTHKGKRARRRKAR